MAEMAKLKAENRALNKRLLRLEKAIQTLQANAGKKRR